MVRGQRSDWSETTEWKRELRFPLVAAKDCRISMRKRNLQPWGKLTSCYCPQVQSASKVYLIKWPVSWFIYLFILVNYVWPHKGIFLSQIDWNPKRVECLLKLNWVKVMRKKNEWLFGYADGRRAMRWAGWKWEEWNSVSFKSSRLSCQTHRSGSYCHCKCQSGRETAKCSEEQQGAGQDSSNTGPETHFNKCRSHSLGLLYIYSVLLAAV